MSLPRPADGTHLFVLDDDAVLYSHRAQELYSFNTAATLIWCSLELGETRKKTMAVLAGALGCSPDEANKHIEQCVAQWTALGVLNGSQRPVLDNQPQRREVRLSGPTPDLPPLREAPEVIECQYRLLTTEIRVRYQSMSQHEWVHPVLAHLEVPVASCATAVSVTIDGCRHCVYVDGRPYSSCTDLNQLAPYVKAVLWQTAITSHRHFLHIHAGVVCNGESLILLPAPSGRGKSTLTAGLVHAGFQYFSDEVALLEEDTFRASPVPVSLCVKSAAWNLLTPLYPQLSGLPAHKRPDGKVARYMPPPAGSLPTDLHRTMPVSRIIFPWYDPSLPTALRRLSKAEALSRLLSQCLAVPLDLNPERIGALVRWISALETHELTISALDKAIQLVSSICPYSDSSKAPLR